MEDSKVRIYYKKLSGDCSDEQSLALYGDLVTERKEKIDKLKNRSLAKKQILISHFLQEVLSKEADVPISRICFQYGSQGKPELLTDAPRPIFFNMSHSGDYVVIAVGNQPVGIDIEHKTRNYEGIAKRCFCRMEYEWIMEAPLEERPHRFLEVWTMKEAYIKWTGEGMRIPFDSFCVCDGSLPVQIVPGEKTDIPGDYVVSLCGHFSSLYI